MDRSDSLFTDYSNFNKRNKFISEKKEEERKRKLKELQEKKAFYIQSFYRHQNALHSFRTLLLTDLRQKLNDLDKL